MRVVEAGPVEIVLIVEHPEEVQRPPGVAAHDEEACGIQRDIGAAVLGIGKIDPPHSTFVIARFEVRLRDHAYLADRRLIHHRCDFAGNSLIDANISAVRSVDQTNAFGGAEFVYRPGAKIARSEEHTSELQSLMRISYAVFCLKKKNNKRLK